FRRQLQVIVDKDRLAAYGFSILDVKMTIDKFNVSRTGGALTYGPYESIIRVDSRALSAEMIENYPISSNKDQIVYVKDVARVLDTYWERRSAYYFAYNGQIEPGIEISVIQNPEASSAQVVPKVLMELHKLESENSGIRFEIAYDNAHFVNVLFENMLHELGIAILLTGIAVLFFLGEWRGAFISLLTIPTSLSLAILGLVPFGMTLNSGTLIGLLLSIGRLVDDSIIDIHAVERYLRMGKNPKEATILGITEVRLAVIASTLMLCLALTPLLFSGGIVQLMFQELVWPFILGLLASMLVSFTLTALLAANILKPHSELVKERSRWFHRKVLLPFQNFLDGLEQRYAGAIAWSLKNRFLVLVPVLITIIIGFAFYNFIGSEMMPLGDVGQAYGLLEMEPGISFAQTEQATLRIQKIFLKHPEVQKVSTEVGTETMFESFSPFFTGYAMPAVNAATFMVTFSDKDEREKTIWDVIDAVQAEAMQTIPSIRRFQIKEMGSDVMASSAAPIQILIYGTDLKMLDRMGEQ
ncbi:MAG: efflux RND transporter permease subunit, partial [Nitrospira sp.]|nr:efflux RND transporter permease subunit [Nitrospira sp.]